MGRRLACLAVLTGVLAAATPAVAVRLDDPRRLWATVNVCNTARHPDTVGIRASMPGTGVAGQAMYMRFSLQYRDAKGAWRPLPGGGTSGWVGVGSARYVVRLAGRSFRFLPPAAGVTQALRGVVGFEWRRGKRVVHRATRTTTAGHPRAEGSDPRGYSAALCEVR